MTHTTQPRTLTEMRGRPTSYEVIALHDDGTELRLGFTQRRTKAALLTVAQNFTGAGNNDLMDLLGDWDGEESWSTGEETWTFGPVRITYSFRTERDFAELV